MTPRILMRSVIYSALVFILLLLPLTQAQENWPALTAAMTMQVTVNGSLTLVPTNTHPKLEEVHAYLAFLPLADERQYIVTITPSSPAADRENGSLHFLWNKPKQGVLTFGYDATVLVENTITPIKNSFPFPITTTLGPEEKRYTYPTALIDSDNPQIITAANAIVKDEDDLYAAVFKIGDWVQDNVLYNLSTLTEEVSQPASWVLANKIGVCDEITTLFIAMLRSQGIPARFVSGLAYTNYQGQNTWGPHGWAEVYFPTVGWVPFDITYGQFGYIDATHIKLRVSQDSGDPSTTFRWFADGVELIPRQLQMNVVEVERGSFTETLPISARLFEDNVRIGSYNALAATIENIHDYYISLELYPSLSEGITFLDRQRKTIYLKPRETKQVFWLIKTDDTLNPAFTYTFSLGIYREGMQLSSTEFGAQHEAPFYSAQEMQDRIVELSQTLQNPQDISCATAKERYYPYEDILLQCTLKNRQEILLRGATVCLQKKCQIVDIPPSGQTNLTFTIPPVRSSQHLIITLTFGTTTQSLTAPIMSLDEPSLNIRAKDPPSSISFGDTINTTIVVIKNSSSNARNAQFTLTENGKSTTRPLGTIAENTTLELVVSGKEIAFNKEQPLHLLLTYEDDNGKHHESATDIVITLTPLTFWQKTQVFFYRVSGLTL